MFHPPILYHFFRSFWFFWEPNFRNSSIPNFLCFILLFSVFFFAVFCFSGFRIFDVPELQNFQNSKFRNFRSRNSKITNFLSSILPFPSDFFGIFCSFGKQISQILKSQISKKYFQTCRFDAKITNKKAIKMRSEKNDRVGGTLQSTKIATFCNQNLIDLNCFQRFFFSKNPKSQISENSKS